MATPNALRRRKPDALGDPPPLPSFAPRRDASAASLHSPTAYEAMATPPAKSPIVGATFAPRRYASSHRSLGASHMSFQELRRCGDAAPRILAVLLIR